MDAAPVLDGLDPAEFQGVGTHLAREFRHAGIIAIQQGIIPIGLVFERFRLVARYRFWGPFREMRHGRPEALRMLEERFFAHVAG